MILTASTGLLSILLLSETVPLTSIHADPQLYEGKIVETCGEAHGRDVLILRNWVSGRSRGGFWLDRPLKEQGYVCVRAKVVRKPPTKRDEQNIIIVSHPPVIPEGWHLRVLKVSKRQ